MYSFQEYRDAARADGVPEHIIDLGLSFARPRIELSSQNEDGRVLAGQYGGHPHLPPDVEWDGIPGFVASIDCAALPQDVLDIPLPRDGNLLFFAEKRYWDVATPHRVIHVPAGTATAERPPPEDEEPDAEDWGEDTGAPYTKPYPLYARLSWSLPMEVDEAVHAAGPEKKELYKKYGLKYYGRAKNHTYPDFVLGGHARSPQDPPYLNSTPGEDEDWILLAQAQYEFHHTPGITACPFWCIRRSDLVAKDFTDMYTLLLSY